MQQIVSEQFVPVGEGDRGRLKCCLTKPNYTGLAVFSSQLFKPSIHCVLVTQPPQGPWDLRPAETRVPVLKV